LLGALGVRTFVPKKQPYRYAPGCWEVRGYHNRGDPWQEQRYSGD
jgi:DMSO/TMAO reductase YedYZ molybdopterin-dependent catalytic subunit